VSDQLKIAEARPLVLLLQIETIFLTQHLAHVETQLGRIHFHQRSPLGLPALKKRQTKITQPRLSIT
jgi:hypothetical protein